MNDKERAAYTEWYQEHQRKQQRISKAMAQLFIAAPDAVQTEEYEMLNDEYLQSQIDMLYMPGHDGEHSHFTTG